MGDLCREPVWSLCHILHTNTLIALGDLLQKACMEILSGIWSKLYLDNHCSLCLESVRINLSKVLHSNYIDNHGRPPAERRACRDQLVKSITYKLLDNHGRPLYRACIKTTLIVMGDVRHRACWVHVKNIAFKLP